MAALTVGFMPAVSRANRLASIHSDTTTALLVSGTASFGPPPLSRVGFTCGGGDHARQLVGTWSSADVDTSAGPSKRQRVVTESEAAGGGVGNGRQRHCRTFPR
jgi:hypothetical protein